jgi:hypothetical protein
LENELAPYYEEALCLVELRTPNYLTALLGSRVTQNWEWMILTPLQLPSIFEKRMLPKGSVFCRYGTRKNRLSSTTHILGGATMGEKFTEGVDKK